MSHQHLDYTSLPRERGFRVTPQRQLILGAVRESEHPHHHLNELHRPPHLVPNVSLDVERQSPGVSRKGV
jgi:Fe2+ or Zn2+ uptake regulation protein